MEKKKIKFGLLPRLLIAIILGILIGEFMPLWFSRTVVTLSGLFSNFLKFVIPIMICAYVTEGIADLKTGAGKLLIITVALACTTTLGFGFGSYLVSYNLFPHFISSAEIGKIAETTSKTLAPYFSMDMPPVMNTISAVILAFVLGLGISSLRGKKEIGDTLYNAVHELSAIIDKVLSTVIIPLLPLYICGTFADMTYSGRTFVVLGILWKVFLCVILMHWSCILIEFTIAGIVSKKNPFVLIKNQLPAYATAVGTQSSAATIPVNLECAKKDGISEQIRNFVVPICASVNMDGSMVTITACATAVCLMYQIPLSAAVVIPFIVTLAIATVASPGAPGGAIMTALPFLAMIFGPELGDPNGPVCALMIALYITQDSFGTACNISGDNAIGVIVDTIYKKFILKDSIISGEKSPTEQQ